MTFKILHIKIYGAYLHRWSEVKYLNNKDEKMKENELKSQVKNLEIEPQISQMKAQVMK